MEAKMTWKRTIYLLLVMVVAASSALTGALAGGVAVYQVVSQNQAVNPPAGNTTILSTNHTPEQSLVVSSTDIETNITQAVQKVGPAVVTIVGTVPGQQTMFGTTNDAKVSGSGFFI